MSYLVQCVGTRVHEGPEIHKTVSFFLRYTHVLKIMPIKPLLERPRLEAKATGASNIDMLDIYIYI